MKGTSTEKADLPDGNYSGRIEGKSIRIRTLMKSIRIPCDADAGDLSIAIFIKIKDGIATFSSKYYQ